MEDGFFAKILENHNIEVVIPELPERDNMQKILSEELIHNIVTQNSRDYFSSLITTHPDCQAVVLGCTEFPLLIDSSNSALPIINPVQLQCIAAVEFALQ
jgi:aspartate racemase